MDVTSLRCYNCGHEWRPKKGKMPKRCPSCLCILGETKATKWKRAERKLAELLVSRGWRLESVGGRKIIDICAERKGKKLLIDVKYGQSYLIRRSQLEHLFKHKNKTTAVGFACEVNGKFYFLKLEEALG